MNDDPVLAAVQKFMDAVEARMTAQSNEIRGLLSELETRAAPKVIEGPAGKDGTPGKDGRDGVDGKPGVDGKDGALGERGAPGLNGKDGESGKDGTPSTVPGPKGDAGERGKDGIATREEIEEVVERQVRGLQFRNLVDYHRGTYERGASYKTSDIAVWDGGTWIAATDTTAVPGTSPDWKQFAKKGRDGRDRTDRVYTK